MPDLSSLIGVGPKTTTYLNNLGIFNFDQLINYYPHRFLDFSVSKKISSYDLTQPATYSGKITKFQNIFTRFHKSIQRATLIDDSGSLDLIWFNQPYLDKQIAIGNSINVAGTVTIFKNKITLISPTIGQKTGRIIPIYHQSSELKTSLIEKIILQNFNTLIKDVTEPLPLKIISKYNLVKLETALKWIHQPLNQNQIIKAKNRLDLKSALYFVANSHVQKTSLLKKTTPWTITQVPKLDFLPFELSPSQLAAWVDIKNELILTTPCHRLLCGDVGSGKTIVALLAANLISHNHQISLLIAPTQILARQHYTFFKKILPHLPVILLDKKNSKNNFAPNSILISTHLAFYQQTEFLKKISLLIIDEQHKFGVSQRNFLNNLPNPPHSLTLSATPIPRTLALSLYGHLQISYLDHLPHWQPVKTFLVPPTKQTACYDWLRSHIASTHEQAFIVCPIIEDSDTMTEVKSATAEFKSLQTKFPKLKIGLIHSKISTENKDKILFDFANNNINIIVTTPLIEVGIDFPNATVIIIQSAERFGLASLHQLRGRVGRGQKPGYCYLFSSKNSPRLNYLTNHYEGQKLAEYDLKTRGPGQFFSTQQHGHFELNIKTISLGHQIIDELVKNYPKFDITQFADTTTSGNLNN